MKEGKQKTEKGCHAEVRTESRGMHGVQTLDTRLTKIPVKDFLEK